MDKRLENKVAIVTGAAQGLGEASARRFAECGASVALVDIKKDQGEAVAVDIVASGGTARFFHCNLTDADAVRHRAVRPGAGFAVVLDGQVLGGADLSEADILCAWRATRRH